MFVVPIFGYSGFKWSPNIYKIIESIVIIFIASLFLPAVSRRPSDFFVHMQFLLPILPMLVLYGASDYQREYMYFVLIGFSIVCVVRKFHLPIIKGNIIPISLLMWSALIFVLIYILFIISKGGLAYFNLDLQKVYEFRADAAENLPGLAGYISPLVSNILLPYILIASLAGRKWGIACLAMIGSVLMFSFTSHKSSLFYPLIALLIYFLAKSEKRLIPLLLVSYILFIGASLLPFVLEMIHSGEQSSFSIIAGSLGFRRGYFTPSQLNFAYYDFFSTHPHTMWAESKLTLGLIDYPYDLSSSYLMGYHLFDNIDTGANTGWLGSGYMHLGILGIIFYAFVIGLVLAVVDVISKEKDHRIVIAVLLIPFLALFTSSDLPTVMLTHGLLFALLLVWGSRFRDNTFITYKPITFYWHKILRKYVRINPN